MLCLVCSGAQLHSVEARFSDQPKTATTRPGSGRPSAGGETGRSTTRLHAEGFDSVCFPAQPKLPKGTNCRMEASSSKEPSSMHSSVPRFHIAVVSVKSERMQIQSKALRSERLVRSRLRLERMM